MCTAKGTKLTLCDIVIKNPRDLLSDLEIKTVNRESVRKLRDKNTLQNVLMTEKRETESERKTARERKRESSNANKTSGECF